MASLGLSVHRNAEVHQTISTGQGPSGALIRSPSQSKRWVGWLGTASSLGSSKMARTSSAEPPT